MDEFADFACTQCGACCRVPGYVRVTEREVVALATHLGMDVEAFTAEHTRLLPDRSGLALLEHADGRCAFLTEEGTCRIQPVKPGQCRTFPYAWRYPDMATICEGWKS